MRSKTFWSVTAVALVGLLVGSSRARAQTDGLLIYLALDDRQGNTAAASDKGEEMIDGVLENDPVWVTVPDDVPGCGGLEFDGVTNFVRIEPEDPFDEPFSPQSPLNEGQITICAWVKVLDVATDNHGQTRQPIVMKGFSGEWEYALLVYDDYGAGMSVWNCGGTGVSEPSAPGTLIQDEWHHVCGTFDVELGVTVYVDGLEVTQSPPNGNEPCDGTRPVFIGHREDGQYLNAQIAEVAIWNRVLEPEEIEDNMAGELATKKEECEEVTCPQAGDPDFADTHCAGIEVVGPDGNTTGGYTATIDAGDDTGDSIRYSLEVYEKDAPDNMVGVNRTGEGEFSFRLDEGTWTVVATVDDDAACDDEAQDSTCTVEVVVAPREGSGLILYLPLDDEDDVTENLVGEDGVLIGGPEWVDGVMGAAALEFDGLTQYVEIPEDLSPQAPANEGELSICAWVRVINVATDAHGQARQPIVMKGAGGEWEYALYVYDDFGAGMSVWNCGGAGVSEPSAPGTLIPEEWHHVCGTFSVTQGVIVYVDGQEVAQLAPNGNEPCDGTQPVLIASRSDGQFLNATVDEVGMWSRVLSPDDVIEVMEEGILPEEPPVEKKTFMRGDCNSDGGVNLADAVCALNFLFGGAAAPGCRASLNVNGDETINIADAVSLLNFLFSGGEDPAPPFPECGPGELPTDEQLGCEVPADCNAG